MRKVLSLVWDLFATQSSWPIGRTMQIAGSTFSFFLFLPTIINTIWEKYRLNQDSISCITNFIQWCAKNFFQSVAPFKFARVPEGTICPLLRMAGLYSSDFCHTLMQLLTIAFITFDVHLGINSNINSAKEVQYGQNVSTMNK